jgi:hypothetical protein
MASQITKRKLSQYAGSITIDDQATFGLLQHTLASVHTIGHLSFNPIDPSAQDLKIIIKGLAEFWQGQKPGGDMSLSLEFIQNGHNTIENYSIPYRTDRVLYYVVELICSRLNFWL